MESRSDRDIYDNDYAERRLRTDPYPGTRRRSIPEDQRRGNLWAVGLLIVTMTASVCEILKSSSNEDQNAATKKSAENSD